MRSGEGCFQSVFSSKTAFLMKLDGLDLWCLMRCGASTPYFLSRDHDMSRSDNGEMSG